LAGGARKFSPSVEKTEKELHINLVDIDQEEKFIRERAK
jgi:hypothetical protein